MVRKRREFMYRRIMQTGLYAGRLELLPDLVALVFWNDQVRIDRVRGGRDGLS